MIMFARDEDAPPPLTDEQQKLFDAHVGHVGVLARKRATWRVPFGDQLQHGLIGLLDAARRFEPERGLKFWTFALPRVIGEMLEAERRGFADVIRVPRTAKKERTPEEWRRFQGTRFAAVEQHQLDVGFFRSIEAPLLAVPVNEPPLDIESLWFAINMLGKSERRLVKRYYVRHQTMREIGEAMGLSESRVSQMHKDILNRLRFNPRVLAASGRRATA